MATNNKQIRAVRCRGVMVSLWQMTYGEVAAQDGLKNAVTEWEIAIGTRVVQQHETEAAATRAFNALLKAIVQPPRQRGNTEQPGALAKGGGND